VTASEPTLPTSEPAQAAGLDGLAGLRVLWTREEVVRGVESIADAMATAFRDSETVNLVPVMTGGLQFAAALSTALEHRAPGKWLISPIFAGAYAADGELGAPVVEFPARFEHRLEPNAPVVVVDDLLDSGTTMLELRAQLKERGLEPVHICVLIERVRERATPLRPDFCAFRLDGDDWLVGFGMDSGRRYRGFDAVYVRETHD
jgi:hypoxanthine phosphoribosyltransferase